MIALDIEIEAEGWDAVPGLDALCRLAAEAALAVLAEKPEGAAPAAPADRPGRALEATLLLADDAALRSLNRDFRGQDKATNVLSFPAPQGPEAAGRPRHLGDIALGFETVARESRDEGKTLADHAAHLVVHGILHLLGHDHGTDPDADAMERIEVAALARLGIPDPYRVAA